MPSISTWGVIALGVIIAQLIVIAVLIEKLRRRASEAPMKSQPAPALFEGHAPQDKRQITAVIAAAIASDMGVPPHGLRIHSIRPVGAIASDRGQFVTAVAAAIASAMGTQPQGLRIRSIRQVGANPGRPQFVAAVAAALAAHMGTDVWGLRIHSIRQVS